MIGTKLAHYVVTSHLGSGGMGEVYQATDTKLGRSVAIKVLPAAFASDTDRLSRFRREAQVLASLNHPKIAQIYGLEESGETCCIIMELVEGETLQARIQRGPVPLNEALEVAVQIADALETAHEKAVVHRDLKPGNVMLTSDGKVKVLDFGLAKAYEPEPSPANLSNSPTILSLTGATAGVILGTAGYMSPEQASGKPVDRRADIWAFGVVLWEMLTGRALFDGETVSHTLADVLRAPISIDRIQAPTQVKDLLARCLDRDIKTRLRDIGEARITIDRYLANPKDQTEPAPAKAPPTSRAAWAFAVMFALCAGAAVTWLLKPVPEQPLLQVEVSAPEGLRLGAISDSLQTQLSPDGRMLVLRIAGKDGKRMLWLRPLDSDSATLLPGTEDSNAPFWSPDSRWIAFTANGRLYKLSIAGGPPVPLCKTDLIYGSWSRDDVILLGLGSNRLQRVSADGGTPVPFEFDTSQGETSQSQPYFLPDGQHFLYDSRGKRDAVVWSSLDGKTRHFFPFAKNSPGYYAPSTTSKNGWILFIRDGQLLAQPFDPARGELAGPPLHVSDGLTGGSAFSVSPAGVLAYRKSIARQTRLTWVGRDGKPLGTVGDAGNIAGPRISPDQKTIAYSLRGGQIWVLDIGRNVTTQLTSEIGNASRPYWSPDGKSVFYDAVRDGNRYTIEKPSNGIGKEHVFWRRDGPLAAGLLGLSHDGRWALIYDRPRSFFMSRPEGKVVPFPEAQISGAGSISPDGHWVLFLSGPREGYREILVESIPIEAGGSAKAVGKVKVSGGTQPHWRADGKEITYIADDGMMISVPVESGEDFFHPLTAKPLFQVHFDFTGSWENYDLTPDGQRFLIPEPSEAADDPPVTIVYNWPKLLEKKYR